MKCIFLLLAPLAFFGASCERHDFEETRKLHEHGDHGKAHGDEHAKDKSHD
ncbi:MAG: hypothetical protein R3242_08170 [Akkermansiaceae bacterium]|nr:hypothetical protein [Akkermansiaceae bacterium]